MESTLHGGGQVHRGEGAIQFIRVPLKGYRASIYLGRKWLMHVHVYTCIVHRSAWSVVQSAAQGVHCVCMYIFNPRRACAARVTVVGLCVCLSVCLFVCLSTTVLALQATRRLMSDTNSFSATRA